MSGDRRCKLSPVSYIFIFFLKMQSVCLTTDLHSAKRYSRGCRMLPNLLMFVGAAGVLLLSGSGAEDVGGEWVYNETPVPSRRCRIASRFKSDRQIDRLGSPAILPAD